MENNNDCEKCPLNDSCLSYRKNFKDSDSLLYHDDLHSFYNSFGPCPFDKKFMKESEETVMIIPISMN